MRENSASMSHAAMTQRAFTSRPSLSFTPVARRASVSMRSTSERSATVEPFDVMWFESHLVKAWLPPAGGR